MLAALQTIVYADLNKRGKFVIQGLSLKHRRVFNGRMHVAAARAPCRALASGPPARPTAASARKAMTPRKHN